MLSKEFKRRRDELFGRMSEQSLLVIPAAPQSIRNRDVEYPYHPESDFHYLTGFSEPDAIVVLKRLGRRKSCFLFCKERDPEMEQWTGERLGTVRAVSKLGINHAWPIEEWEQHLPELLSGVNRLYFNLGEGSSIESMLLQQMKRFRQRNRSGVVSPQAIYTPDTLLHEMRLIKSIPEQQAMRKAAAITTSAHVHAMRQCRVGMNEQRLEGEILHSFSRHGTRTVAYGSIVAGGNNACTLHYVANRDDLQQGDLVLIDAGAEWDGYAADVTRTFPVNGRFSEPQRQLYEVVLAAQRAAIRKIRPGKRWDSFHRAAVREITKGLLELNILEGDLNTLIKEEGYKPYYMHQTGHWLGMDVHDVGAYKVDGKWRVLEPGMVMTVEPGIYIPKGMKGVADEWQGIGIRIEDDVLVTESGNEVLTEAVPKAVDEIEQLMAGARTTQRHL